MIVKFDSLNRFEPPKLTLCNPGSEYKNGMINKIVGMLSNTEAEEIVFNFNATSELNFRLNKIKRDSTEENEYVNAIYRGVQNRRLLFAEDIGYFMITSVEEGCSDGIHYKDIKAQSADVEIAQKMIPFIEDGTYKFTTDETGTKKGILETIVETIPLWTIGYVDKAVSEKFRTFEDIDTNLNCLSFLLDNVQEAYECIILFDILNRTINVYDQNNYVKQTNIHITKNDFINSIDITESADDLYTAVNVLGDDNVTISAINPLGTNVIYDFSHYLDWMSDSLRSKVIEWQNNIEQAKESYYNSNLQYYKKMAGASSLNAEIERLSTQITLYMRCRNNIVAESSTDLVNDYNEAIISAGGQPVSISEDINETLAYIDNLIALCESEQDNNRVLLESVNNTLETIKAAIEETHESLAISKVFSEAELSELSNYIYEGGYTDEYVTITDVMSYEDKFEQMKILYDRAEARLKKLSKPTQEFDIDVESFVFLKEFEQWSEQLETGCLINVELGTDDIASLFLSNITINYDDHSLSLTFGNRFNKFDPKSLFDDVLGEISKSANSIGFIKDILYPIKNGEFNKVKNALQTSRDITMQGALASEGEQVVIDGSGYTGKKKLDNGTFDPRQVKITGKTLVFTDDAWESCKVALGELIFGNGETAYGINAEAVIGDIIMGNNLRIVDKNGNDLLSVVDGKITTSVEEINKSLSKIEQLADSINIRVSSLEAKDGEVDHVTTTTGYTFDANGLQIYKSGEEIKNLLDNTGMYVTRSDDEILTANNEGVTAINLSAKQYLIVGANSRFEDYTDGTGTKRTACFYIGV